MAVTLEQWDSVHDSQFNWKIQRGKGGFRGWLLWAYGDITGDL